MVRKKAQLRIQVCGNQRFPGPEFSKKAQLKIQEMSFMLVGVILFFIIVGLFALTIVNSNLQKEARQIKEAETLAIVGEMAGMAEFSCVGDRSSCVDADKLIGLMKSSSYKNLWKLSSLEVFRESSFDKSEGEMIDCNRDSYIGECDRFVIFDNGVDSEERIGSYVALCRVEYENYYPYEKCEMGRIVVGREVG